tara:strand:+ start:238 stop:591 length:354 start_codon:yes stop_codon:yes gene_type:complete
MTKKRKTKKKMIKLDCEEGYQEFHTKFVKKQKRKSKETLYVIYWRYGNWKHQFCGVTNNFDKWLEEYNKERISLDKWLEPESAYFFDVLEVPTTLFVESKKPSGNLFSNPSTYFSEF